MTPDVHSDFQDFLLLFYFNFFYFHLNLYVLTVQNFMEVYFTCECLMNCVLQKFTYLCCTGDAVFQAKATAPKSLPGASPFLFGCCEGAFQRRKKKRGCLRR